MPHRWSRIFGWLTFSALVVLGCSDRRPEELPVVNAQPALAKISTAYDIQIVAASPVFPVRTWHGIIDGKRAEANEIDRYAVLFAREFTLYPPALVQRSGLKRVVLCKALSFAGQLRGAIPDFEHDDLYLDVVRGGTDSLYLRKVIHHEFFHVIDYLDDGRLYEDKHWASLNPSGFKYGTGGKHAQLVPAASALTDKVPGFLNYYSTTGVEEDKAELFANMIVDPTYVEGRSRSDRVLKAKMQAMKELLARFCPDVDEQFWEKTRKTSRDGAR